MKQFIITAQDEGQRLDRYLSRLLPNAGKSFIYKMLRKKNIVLNRHRGEGDEKLSKDDVIEIYFSDDTFDKFSGGQKDNAQPCAAAADNKLDIIYEDSDIMLINKPKGVLSQKASAQDVSLVEMIIDYALSSGKITKKQLVTCRPSVCNRLDRNTSGLVAAGLSIKGLAFLSDMFKTRTLHKYYLALVSGRIDEAVHLKGYLYKDEKSNKVTILKELPVKGDKEFLPIETSYEPAAWGDKVTLIKVLLITGRSHQIRAHLASSGHPVIGDSKYGNRTLNQEFAKKAKVKDQLLHAYEVVFPECSRDFEYLSGRSFKAPLPEEFMRALKAADIDTSILQREK